MDEFDILEWLLTGKSVPLVIDGVEFSLRQPKPLEVDRMQYQQTRAFDMAMAEYKADGLSDEPITPDLAEAIRVYNELQEQLYQQAQADGDTEAATRVAREQERVARQQPQTLAEERARNYSRRVVARFIVDNLLEGDKAVWRELTTPDPLERAEVTAAVDKLLSLVNHNPNSNRRTQ